jgi:8-oxo-dGTP pyrophosphatase MutT (NUDIX family)
VAAILSCGVVLVRDSDQGIVTLMLRAYNYWDFPKGVSEPGEDPIETAVRELREETGIHDIAFSWGERYLDTGPYSRGKTARYYLASTSTEEVVLGPSPETGRPEHNAWRWLDFDAAHDLAVPRVREVVRWARQIVGA